MPSTLNPLGGNVKSISPTVDGFCIMSLNERNFYHVEGPLTKLRRAAAGLARAEARTEKARRALHDAIREASSSSVESRKCTSDARPIVFERFRTLPEVTSTLRAVDAPRSTRPR